MNDNEVNINKEDYNQILDRNIAWIENCDTKASIILGGIGVVFGILLVSDYVKKIIEIFKYMADNIGFGSVLYIGISVLSIFTFIVGVFFLMRVLVPKKNPQIFKEKGVIFDSLIFFQSIAKTKHFKNLKQKF